MQVSSAYAALVEDVKEWHTKGVFLREWSLLIQVGSFSLLDSSGNQLTVPHVMKDQSQVLWLARALPPIYRRHERRQIRRSSRPPPSRREFRQGGQSPGAALHVYILDNFGRQLAAGRCSSSDCRARQGPPRARNGDARKGAERQRHRLQRGRTLRGLAVPNRQGQAHRRADSDPRCLRRAGRAETGRAGSIPEARPAERTRERVHVLGGEGQARPSRGGAG